MSQTQLFRRPRLILVFPLLFLLFWFWVTNLFSPMDSSTANPNSVASSNTTSGDPDKEILYESMPCIRIFKSGRVERYFGSEFVNASTDPATGVSSKDVLIQPGTGVGARLYLPKSATTGGSEKFPILVYYHGGGFCLGSAYNPTFHNYFNAFVALSSVVIISIEYRLAPEHPVPVAYEDSWVALQWVTSHADGRGPEAWISNHADFSRLYLGGESAGANIAHHMAIRAGVKGLEKGAKIKGLAMIHPYFMGTYTVESDAIDPAAKESLASLWKVVCPTTTGIDDPLINPFVEGAPGLEGLACGRVLVCVGEKDVLRDRGKTYYKRLKECGWGGEVELREAVGVGHTFHLLDPTSEQAVEQDKAISAFLNRE